MNLKWSIALRRTKDSSGLLGGPHIARLKARCALARRVSKTAEEPLHVSDQCVATATQADIFVGTVLVLKDGDRNDVSRSQTVSGLE